MLTELLNDKNKLEKLMRIVINESLNSLPDDVPIGAAVFNTDAEIPKIISCSHNTRELKKDSTDHAEIISIRKATSTLNDWRLENCILVSTLEPCVMCTGALVKSKIRGVVFGAHDLQYGACGSIYNFLSDPRLNHNAPIVGGILEEECSSQLKNFFNELRK